MGRKRRDREHEQREAEAKQLAWEAARQQADLLGREMATRQFIAMKDAPERFACPATGHPVDARRFPKVLRGPYYSKPYGIIGFRKCRKWYLSPVATETNPCLTIMWTSVEVEV